MRQIPVLFENNACLILNKPAGLAVQGGKGVDVSLDSILGRLYKDRPLLVHRLDKDTSGLLLAAKGKEAAAAFSALFGEKTRDRGMVKRYLGAVAGIPCPRKGVIRLDLEIRGNLRKSETFYQVLASSPEPEEARFSLLELELGTGRMHQIRRHLHMIDHPLLGDDKYGDFSLNKSLHKTRALKRLLLHASRLIIPPVPSFLPQGLDIAAPLPDYFLPFFPDEPAVRPRREIYGGHID